MSDKPRRGRPPGAYGPYQKSSDHDPRDLARDRQPERRSRYRGDTPRPASQDQADGWVCHGVQQLARTAPRDEHVVLMAASYEHSGKVGAASSIRCDSMAAMSALGRLVAEVNRAFVRDNVCVRVELRMKQVEALDVRHERLILRQLDAK